MELVNAPMERRIVRERTIAASEAQLIAAVTKFGIEKLHSDPAFAEQVAERHFTRVFEKQQNKDAVLREALEDLRNDHGTEARTGRPLDAEFLDRLEHYAEGASSDRLRQKWGRVLSAEIKQPGTFSSKVMRIVDELEPETAQLFECLCKSSFNGIIPKCLVGTLTFANQITLVSAGLLIDPGMTGHIATFDETTSSQGKELWTFEFKNGWSVSMPKDTQLPEGGLPDFGVCSALRRADENSFTDGEVVWS